jgi:hypothetical protein
MLTALWSDSSTANMEITLSDKPEVIIRTLEREYPVSAIEKIPALVDEWSDVLRNAQSWSRAASTRLDLQQNSRNQLAALSIGENDLRILGNAGLIEIKVRCPRGELAPAAHLPWELLLASATQNLRPQPLIVVRHLECGASSYPVTVPERLLVVKSSPGFLSDIYTEVSFRTEQKNVEANVGLESSPDVWNPTLAELAHVATTESPHIIHFAGIDIVQARELAADTEGGCTIEEQKSLSSGEDFGMVFRHDDGLPLGAGPFELARKVCHPSQSPPSLVAYNFHNTARMAAAVVSQGAQIALGCQGELDDILSEIFYCNFYLAWRLGNWKVLDGLRLAMAELREVARADSIRAQKLWGSSIVVWSSHSLLDSEKNERFRKKPKSLVLPSESLRETFDRVRLMPAKYDEGTVPISVELIPRKELNYSLLHNNRSLFHYFYIRKLPPLGQVKNIAVETVLFAGDEKFPYKSRRDLKYTLWMLGDEIRVPLTSKFAKSVRESLYASLLVKISLSDKVVFEETYRVMLLPIDQWQDNDRSRKWLPSFVLPRDPAVSQILGIAQKYLVALADDAGAGFDGYQTQSDDVNAQVRALWYALAYDYSLRYINPPPSFTEEAQRLRPASEVIKGLRGTCIDLTLLLASCLEYIGIFPVLFLFDGHAFAGYYRTEATHQEVREWISRSAGPLEEDAWMLGSQFYSRVLELVMRGDLIPIETTLLTKRGGFSEALNEGVRNLTSQNEYEFLIDLKLARENGVTPLPLWDQEP